MPCAIACCGAPAGLSAATTKFFEGAPHGGLRETVEAKRLPACEEAVRPGTDHLDRGGERGHAGC
jgi:hypothetical protein